MPTTTLRQARGIEQWLGVTSRRWGIVLAIALLVLVAYVDWLTGPGVAMMVFYIVPVALLTWFGGWRAGVVMAVVASIAWSLIVVHARPNALPFEVEIWNGLMRTTTLLIVVQLVHVCHGLLRQVEQLVEEKTAVLTTELETRRRAEEAIRELAAKLSVAEDAERQRLAQDIHDTLGQNLSALKMNLQAAAKRAGEGRGGWLSEPLAEIEKLIEQTRTMTFDLYPPLLHDLGLVSALQRHAEQFSRRTHIQVSVDEAGTRRELTAAARHYVFRAVKELINNAAKHGPATEIIVGVHWREGGVRVVVDDDGHGFDASEALKPESRRGLGLAWIQERARYLGGDMIVESASESGSRVIVDVAVHGAPVPMEQQLTAVGAGPAA